MLVTLLVAFLIQGVQAIPHNHANDIPASILDANEARTKHSLGKASYKLRVPTLPGSDDQQTAQRKEVLLQTHEQHEKEIASFIEYKKQKIEFTKQKREGNKSIELTGVPNFDSTCQGQPCITKTNSAAIKHVAKYTSGSDGPTIIPLNPEVPCDLGSFKTTDNVDYTKDADYSSIYNFPSHDQTSSDPPGDISAIYAGVKAYRRENECYDETYGGGYGYCSVHQTQQSVQDGVCKRWAESQDLDDFRCGPMREKCSKFCRKWMVNMPSFEIPNPPTINLDLPNLDLSLDLDLPWWGIDVPTCASATGTDCDLPSFPNVRFPDFPELPEFTLPTLPLPKIPALHVQTSFVQKAEFKHMMEPPECEDYKHELEVMISTAGHTGCYDFWGNPCNGVAFSQCPGRICKRWRPVCGWSCFGYSGSALTREEDDGCYSQWKQAPLCYEPRAPETVPPPPPPAVTLEDYCYSCAQCDSATYPAEGSYLVHQITIFDSTRMCDRNYGVNQGGTCTGSRDVDWATVFSGSPYPHMATSYPISLKEAFCRQCQVLRGHQPVLRDHIGTDSGAAGMSIRSAPTDHVAQGICKKQDYNTCSSHIPEHALTAWHRACPLLDPANYDSYGFPKSANFEERLKDALFKQKMKTYQEAELGVLLKMTPSYPTCTYDASSDTDGPFVTQTGGGHLSECKYPGMCCHSQFREFEVDHHVIGKRWTPRTGQYGYYCKLPPFYVHPHLFSPIPENAAEGDFKCQKCVEDYEPCPFAANNANPCCNPRSSYQFDGPNKGLCADSTCVAPVPQLKGRPFARDIKEIVLEPHKCTFANFARGWTNADSEVAGIVQGDCCGTSTCRPANHFRIAPHVCIACAEEGQECAYKYTDGWEKFHQFADCCDPAANVCTHVGDGKHTCQQSHDVRNPTFD